MLLTARPDLLPIDLKRQGRAEVHIPLFYPTDEARDPPDVRDPREEARLDGWRSRTCRRFRSAGSCRAPTSKAWSAARGARRCSPAPITSRARRSPSVVVAVHAVDAGARARAAGDRGDPRVHRPRSSCRRRFSRRWTAEGGRAKLQARLTALKQIWSKELCDGRRTCDGTHKLVRRQGGTPG